jgi:hypothetical protein
VHVIRIQNTPGLRYLMSQTQTVMLSETVVDRPDQFPHRDSPLPVAACKTKLYIIEAKPPPFISTTIYS